MSEAQKRADALYRKKRVQKTVVFNAETDAELLKIANALPDFSGWVKQKILDHADQVKHSQESPTA